MKRIALHEKMSNKMYKHFIWIALLFTGLYANAGINEYSAEYHGTQIDATVTPLVLEDEFYAYMQNNPLTWGNEFTNQEVVNRVILKYTGQEKKQYTAAWSITVNVDIESWDEDGTALTTVSGEDLVINYDPTANYVDMDLYTLTNAHKVKVTINSVTNTMIGGVVPNDVFLEVETKVERYFNMDQTSVPKVTHTHNTTDAIAELQWSYIKGAEEYDVEWYFSSNKTPNPVLPGDIADEDFTRITTSSNSYQFNATFDNGTIYYRVRAVGRFGTNFEHRKEGQWTNNGSHKFTVTNIDEDKNWTYTANYAEEGKVRDGVSYFDGSGRNRQTVAKNNTDGVAIFSETHYDYEGRGAVQTMPAPEKLRTASLKFFSDYSLNSSTNLFSRVDFDYDVNDCAVGDPGMHHNQGSSNYYSDQNSEKDEGFNAYLPDAADYPYSRTVFGLDGRVKEQSGVGPDHKVGFDHSTKYYYATPFQKKLDRLFGNEVGFAHHYRLNAVKDPNGQIAMTYLDLSGRTIATSITGNAPTGMKNVADALTQQAITINFNNINYYNPLEEAYIINTTIFVEVADEHDFTYTITPETWESLCADTSGDCVYDLIITIYDDCDRPIYSGADPFTAPTTDQVMGITHEIDATFIANDIPITFTVDFPSVGTYRIEKKLTLNQEALDDALAAFLAKLPGDCITPLDTLLEEYGDAIDWDDCMTCEAFCDSFPSLCAADECEAQVPDDSNCDVLLDFLEADMSPGGQYFDNQTYYNPGSVNNNWMNNATNVWIDGALYWQDAGFTIPGTSTVITTWAGMRTHWQPGWATRTFDTTVDFGGGDTYNTLVEFHPEYCHYEDCLDMETSHLFDAKLYNITTYDAASDSGYIVPSDINDPKGTDLLEDDPFFAIGGYGASKKTNMETELASDALWDDATDLADSLNAECDTSDCDEKWLTFRALYLSKKNDFFEALKAAGSCDYLCDETFPPDMVADDCGGNPNNTHGFIIRQPDLDIIVDTLDENNIEDFETNVEPLEEPCDYAFQYMTIEVDDFTCAMYIGLNLSVNDGTNDYSIVNGQISTSLTNDDDIATWLADQINDYVPVSGPDFTAVANGSEIVITAVDPGFTPGYTLYYCCNASSCGPLQASGSAVFVSCDSSQELPHCFCTELQLQYDSWEAFDSNLTAADIHDTIADDYNALYGFTGGDALVAADIEDMLDSCTSDNIAFPTAAPEPWDTLYAGCEFPSEPPCGEDSQDLSDWYATEAYNWLVDSASQAFIADYKRQCFLIPDSGGVFGDTLTMEFIDMEHQFTLYYYGQAGNLVRTVPPKGVNQLSDSECEAADAHRNDADDLTKPFVYTEHSYITNYEYNSLNQLVKQDMPDVSSVSSWKTDGTTNPISGNPTLNDVFAVGLDEYYAAADAGKVYHTTDGGANWSDVSPGGVTDNLNALHFSDANTGYVVGNNGALYRTTDGGANWTDISGLFTENFEDIVLTNSTTAFVVGDDKRIIRSTDIDAATPTWTSYNYTASSTALHHITFVDEDHGFAVGAGDVILETTNGSAATPTFSSTCNTCPSGSITFYSIAFTDNNTGYAAGATTVPQLYQTTDGGTNWTDITSNTGISTGKFFDVYFHDANTGYITGSSGIVIETDDGGANWTDRSVAGSDSYAAISGPGADQLILVGKSGVVMGVEDDAYGACFWYNDVAQLVASQNAKQAGYGTPGYSYSAYDGLGRVVEAGELTSNTEPTASVLNGSNYPNNWETTRSEVVYTHYDEAINGTIDALFGSDGQENLRSRVATTGYKDLTTDSDYKFATHYSYDIHGNVSTLIQENDLLAELGHQYKRMDYEYDLVSGNVNKVWYEKDSLDQFIHEYCYDADNRITAAFTSRDNHIWNKDAAYFYHLHGPLARTEVGEHKVQGIDHAYTLQGWLKGVNSNDLDETIDMGKDGLDYTVSDDPYFTAETDIHDNIARDAFGFSLGYYDTDYTAINASFGNDFLSDIASVNSSNQGEALYNGNIQHMATALMKTDETLLNVQATLYQYDQLNRLRQMNAFNGSTYTGATDNTDFYTYLEYDRNGNIDSLKRNGEGINQNMDNFNYHYTAGTNRLTHVEDGVIGSPMTTDLESQSSGNYAYNAIGELTQDALEEIEAITWYINGKVKMIQRNNSSHSSPSGENDLEFHYDPQGNRVMKVVKPRNAGVLSNEEEWSYTYYVRDANGELMATYERSYTDNTTNYDDYLKLKELPVYGSKRLGMHKVDETLYERNFTITGYDSRNQFLEDVITPATAVTEEEVGFYTRTLGERKYELSNHLGNVLAVVSDRKIEEDADSDGTTDYYTADVLAYSDYYPFGSLMPGRNGNHGNYRFSFQGQEHDDEVKGEGNSVNYKYRMHDPRTGRFFAVDPLAAEYAYNSPYAFSENQVIAFVELEGLEKSQATQPYIPDNVDDDLARDIAKDQVGSRWAGMPPNINFNDPAQVKVFEKSWEVSEVNRTFDAATIEMVGFGVGSLSPLPVVNSISGFMKTYKATANASKLNHVFRGTSQGFPGNKVLQDLKVTPTSINPSKATAFALESSSYGNGTLLIAHTDDLGGATKASENFFGNLEEAININMSPLKFEQSAGIMIKATDARAILKEMNVSLPSTIRGKAALDDVLKGLSPMSNDAIEKFVKEAQKVNLKQ